jgi:hypothetical protein
MLRRWLDPRIPDMRAGASEPSRIAETVREGLRRAEAYVVAERFRGYDPYDALTSPLFRLPVLRSSRIARRGAQQILRRTPFNLRPLLAIPKGLSPVTLALVLHAWADLALADPSLGQQYAVSGALLVSELERLASPGWSGACWGYDFDWETRDGRVPARTPTVVATTFVTNGLVRASDELGLTNGLALSESATRFVLNDLARTKGPEGSFCWSYSPLDQMRVLNATAKGSRLLAQVYQHNGREELRDAAERSLRYVVAHQRDDGSWPYAVADPRTWVDNFHSGYVLDALAEYSDRTGDTQFAEAADRGWRYYREHFFEEGRVPKYYDTSLYPIDATACAQSLLTLTRYGDVETALRVADWTVRHMQRPDGSFVYQIRRRYVNRVPYMRWSTAWMLCGLAAVVRADSAEVGETTRGVRQ